MEEFWHHEVRFAKFKTLKKTGTTFKHQSWSDTMQTLVIEGFPMRSPRDLKYIKVSCPFLVRLDNKDAKIPWAPMCFL